MRAVSKFERARHANSQPAFSCSLVYLTYSMIIFWLGLIGYFYYHGILTPEKLIHSADSYIDTTKLRGDIIGNNHNSIEYRKNSQEKRYKDPPIYVVFSTDCSTYQDWQTIVLFHSAKQVKQPGVVTRIASGCDKEKEIELTRIYEQLYPDKLFNAHFTPDFKRDPKTNRSCKY